MQNKLLISLIIPLVLLTGCQATDQTLEINAQTTEGEKASSLSLQLDHPPADLELLGMPSTKYDQFVGGWYLLTTENPEIDGVATVTIEVTQAGIEMFNRNPVNDFDIETDDLSLAYYDKNQISYNLIESEFDRENMKVSAQIDYLYSEGIMLVAE